MSRPTVLLFSFAIVCAVSLAACQATPPANVDASTPPTTESVQPAASASDSAGLHSPVPGEKKATIETSYISPGGEEKVGFTIYVDAEGVITDAETAVKAKSPTSVMRQTSFATEFPTVLKGKKLSDLDKVDRIGGSSLTTGAFNKALTDLKAQI